MSDNYKELPLNIEDLPQSKNDQQPLSYKDKEKAALAFVTELNDLVVRNENPRGAMKKLYDCTFHQICETYFKNECWPSCEVFEEDYNVEFSLDTIQLYKELTYRHAYSIQSTGVTPLIRNDSWENYKDIFHSFGVSSSDALEIPVQWTWDIIEEFLYQFQTNCAWFNKNKDEADKSSFWNLEEVEEILNKMITKSKILVKDSNNKEVLADLQEPKSIHYFGFYCLVGLLRLKVMLGDFEGALKSIEAINFNKLAIFTKSFPCCINLFYYSGFAYLMLGRPLEAIKTFEALLCFMNKYKQFFSKSFQYENINRQGDKALALYIISLLFYPAKQEQTLSALIKEQNADKIERIQNYDIPTFIETFNYSAPKFFIPIKNQTEVKEKKDIHQDKPNPQESQREALLQKLKNAQKLNEFSSILKLYSTVTLQKVSKIMNCPSETLKQILSDILNTGNLKDNEFEQTIVSRFTKGSKTLDFTLTGDSIKLNEKNEQKNYCAQFEQMSHSIDAMVHELDELDLQFIKRH